MQGEPRAQPHIAVCDDEPSDTAAKLWNWLGRFCKARGFSCAVSSYSGGAELLDAIRKGASSRILLLDAMMGTLDGMDLACPQSFSSPPTVRWRCGGMGQPRPPPGKTRPAAQPQAG